MSLFSTITHREEPGVKGVSPRGAGIATVVVVVGLTVAYFVSNIDTAEQSPQPAISATWDYDRFLQVNT